MKRVLVSELPRPGHMVPLPESEANHAIKVLRLRNGDVVEVLDGQGHSAYGILRIKSDGVRLEHTQDGAGSPLTQQVIWPIVLEIATLKGEAMEWVIEKSVELGVKRLVPLLTAHTVVQIKGKGPNVFQQRWQKIADQSLKQCGRLERMEVDSPTPLEALVTHFPASPAVPRLWCDEGVLNSHRDLAHWVAKSPFSFTEVRLLIGPEGGWSEKEREMLLRSGGHSTLCLTLGPWVLRSETAALFGISLLSARFRNSENSVSLEKGK